MASTSSTSKKIVLRSSDGYTFEVDETVATQCQTIEDMIEDVRSADDILLPNVTGAILAKVVEYCKKHAGELSDSDKASDDELKEWDQEFLKVDQNTLFDIILAANYMNIKSLLELTCQCVANMMKGKTPQEIRDTFHIKNDYTPEEEAEVRRENQWAFE